MDGDLDSVTLAARRLLPFMLGPLDLVLYSGVYSGLYSGVWSVGCLSSIWTDFIIYVGSKCWIRGS